MKRVKAFGFISILEREFRMDLTTLKTECAAFFASEPDEAFDAKHVVSIPVPHEQSGGFFSKLIVLLVLLVAGYGAWTFVADKNSMQENNITASTTGFVGSIVNQAKEWLGSSSDLVSGAAPDETNSSVGAWAQDNTEQNRTGVETQGDTDSTQSSMDTATKEQNDSQEEEQIIKDAKEEQKQKLAEATAQNSTEDAITIESLIGNSSPQSDAQIVVTEDTPIVEDTPAAIESATALAVEVPSMTEQSKADEVAAAQKQAEEKQKAVKKKKSVVTLHPTKKVWIGYTELATMKRAAKVIEEDIDFDTTASDWILVAGHNAINFVIKGKHITPKKREKNYFLIKKGKVKAISQKEFQKLNKSTVW